MCYRYYRVLLISAVCYRARFFLWGALVALLPLATACYFLRPLLPRAAFPCRFWPLGYRVLPRAIAFATACYRVRYRVLSRLLPRATGCYRVLQLQMRPQANLRRKTGKPRARAFRRPSARGSRIQNPKKKTQKKLSVLLIRLASSKSRREWERASVCSTILGVIGNVECIRVEALRVYLRPTNGSCYCSCSRLPAVTKRAPPPPQDGSLAADGGSEIDERPLSPLIVPDQVSVTLLRSLDRTA